MAEMICPRCDEKLVDWTCRKCNAWSDKAEGKTGNYPLGDYLVIIDPERTMIITTTKTGAKTSQTNLFLKLSKPMWKLQLEDIIKYLILS